MKGAVTCHSFFWWFSSWNIHYFPTPTMVPSRQIHPQFNYFWRGFSKRNGLLSMLAGPKSRPQGMHFPIPLAHRQLKQFPIQTLLCYSSPGEYCDDLYRLFTSSLTISFELFTLKAVRSTTHIWGFNDISGLLKHIQFECDKTANTNR